MLNHPVVDQLRNCVHVDIQVELCLLVLFCLLIDHFPTSFNVQLRKEDVRRTISEPVRNHTLFEEDIGDSSPGAQSEDTTARNSLALDYIAEDEHAINGNSPSAISTPEPSLEAMKDSSLRKISMSNEIM